MVMVPLTIGIRQPHAVRVTEVSTSGGAFHQFSVVAEVISWLMLKPF